MKNLIQKKEYNVLRIRSIECCKYDQDYAKQGFMELSKNALEKSDSDSELDPKRYFLP
jgi:hypothetical protein